MADQSQSAESPAEQSGNPEFTDAEDDQIMALRFVHGLTIGRAMRVVLAARDRGPIVTELPLYSPDTDHAWQAVRESYEPGDAIGYGCRPNVAVADLLMTEAWRAE